MHVNLTELLSHVKESVKLSADRSRGMECESNGTERESNGTECESNGTERDSRCLPLVYAMTIMGVSI